jgi:hypothetical protein
MIAGADDLDSRPSRDDGMSGCRRRFAQFAVCAATVYHEGLQIRPDWKPSGSLVSLTNDQTEFRRNDH